MGTGSPSYDDGSWSDSCFSFPSPPPFDWNACPLLNAEGLLDSCSWGGCFACIAVPTSCWDLGFFSAFCVSIPAMGFSLAIGIAFPVLKTWCESSTDPSARSPCSTYAPCNLLDVTSVAPSFCPNACFSLSDNFWWADMSMSLEDFEPKLDSVGLFFELADGDWCISFPFSFRKFSLNVVCFLCSLSVSCCWVWWVSVSWLLFNSVIIWCPLGLFSSSPLSLAESWRWSE